VICPCLARIANIDNTAHNLKYYMTRKAVSIICLASYIVERKTENSLKMERDKANKIPASYINIVTYGLRSKYINSQIQIYGKEQS
jgi:hypothetical protein